MAQERIIHLVKKNTVRLKHGIPKRFLCPSVFKTLDIFESLVTGLPRPMIAKARKHFKHRKFLVGAEIGVAQGRNALSILNTLPTRKLYLIDPYLPYIEESRQIDPSADLNSAKERLENETDRIEWFIEPSESASTHFLPETLDFVYIDGNHDYESVKKDIALYFPLIRKGGLIGGHDYVPFYPDVKKAVDEYVTENMLQAYSDFPDWYIIKKVEKDGGIIYKATKN